MHSKITSLIRATAVVAILGAGAEKDPIAATISTLSILSDMVCASGTKEPLRFTSAFADGENLYAFRYCTDNTANTLYYREVGGSAVVVSEPLDTERARWTLVPPGHLIVSRPGQPVELIPMTFESRVAAE